MRKNKEHLWLYSILLSLIFAMGFLIISLLLASNIKIAEAYIKTRYSGEDVYDSTYLNEKEIQCLKEFFIKELEDTNKELKRLGYDD